MNTPVPQRPGLQRPHRLGADLRSALAGRVYDHLRNAILDAALLPGEAISENGLAQQLQVSRTPVREATQGLVRDGLVHVLPQRGSYVALLSMQRILEALFVREAVESKVVRQIAESQADPARLRALDDCIAHHAAASRADDPDGTMRWDERFHFTLLELCGMPGLWPVVTQARDMHRRLRAIAMPELQSGDEAIADHRAIVKALRKRDADAAQQCIASHLRRNALLMRRIANLHPDYFEVEANVNPRF